MTFGGTKIVFPYKFHDIGYYVYDFENHYWMLHIHYQFIIIICEILLNTTQNKT